MKKYHIPIIALLLVFSIVSLSNPVKNEVKPSRSHKQTLRRIVTTYHYSKDPTSIKPLLETLSDLDTQAASQWEEIINYWDYANTDMILNDTPPDDLEITDNLCFVVLGFQLNADGSMRKELRGRLEQALLCAQQYPNSYVLCTGGGTASRNKRATEAQVMANWLQGNGIDPDRILIEDASMSTTQNAINSVDLLQKNCPKVRSIVIVTSDYHVAWGAVLFQAKCILESSDLRVVSNVALCTNTSRRLPITDYQRDGILAIAKLA